MEPKIKILVTEKQKDFLIRALQVLRDEYLQIADQVISPTLRNGFTEDANFAGDLITEAQRALPENPLALEDTVVSFLRAYQKIQAIKHVRNVTGHGLKESKEYVDGIQAKHGIVIEY